ncbi:MAG: gluconate 2-dehydrogenase subunit 3 family protein [Hyphomicrobiaceae bacterium]|nr:gluconate 2-dehydrogenase subunit 3 family protein [Hyphomicrobiaceae bacterium]
MTDLSRRTLLKGAGVVGAASTVPAAAQHAADHAPPGLHTRQNTNPNYRFFNAVEAAFVEAAVERLIPADPQWPGALAAGVPVFIDRQLAGPYGRGETLYLAGPWKQGTTEQGYQLRLSPAELYRTSLERIGQSSNEGKTFHQRSGDEQDAFLRRLEAGDLDLGGFSSAIFFETLLANTVEGFFADPAYGGNRDKAGWRMVGFPGAYAAFLQLYTHHGMTFDREPLGMDEHTGAHPVVHTIGR